MAATILNSTRAVEMSLYVVRAFIQLREFLASNKDLANRLDALEARIERKLATHDKAIVFDALEPARLSRRARAALEAAARTGSLACADISLWEIAMLIARKRIQAGADTRTFLEDVIAARRLAILPITPEIAAQAQSPDFTVGDPVVSLLAVNEPGLFGVMEPVEAVSHGHPGSFQA